tara:strand:+ start:4441 stop:5094 length:654 start_codon:yes stop_codon:yes gene_type:complete
MRGRLVAITGPMFSGKSSELINRVKLAELQGKDVVCYTPDSRFNKTTPRTSIIKSRSGVEVPAFPLDSKLNGYKIFSAFTEAIRMGFSPPDVIAIDEAQFFYKHELGFAVKEMILHYGVNFIVAGLSRDYTGNPFGAMPRIITMADEVVQLFAVCNKCKSTDATKTVRISEARDKIVLGSNHYNAYCSTCHWEHSKTPDEIKNIDSLKSDCARVSGV